VVVIAVIGQIPSLGTTPATLPPVATPTSFRPSSGDCTLDADFGADVTVPDDTVFSPGAQFIKTWRIRNSGTCDWESGYKLVFVQGDLMDGEETVAVPATPAGSTVDVSVNLVAPAEPGTYQGHWELRTPEGSQFGRYDTYFVRIVVSGQAPSGLEGRIVFVCEIDGRPCICVMNADGTDVTELTSADTPDWHPTWSPDGTRIAFASGRGDHSDVYVMDADGTNVTQLAHTEWDVYTPSWSPSGIYIAFSGYRHGDFEIYVMAASTVNLTQLTDDDADNADPAWSPDSARIAFTSNRDGNDEIYVMGVNGENVIRLTHDSGRDWDPAWSPDGTRIAFTSDRDGDEDIYLMDANGESVVRLTDNDADDREPAWSPDGTRIIFSSRRDGPYLLYVMDTSGLNVVKLTERYAYEPNWSP
jgi:Tol biopolymer transport system component